jgi:DNA uptake protein ComE-like DNA-binding protein
MPLDAATARTAAADWAASGDPPWPDETVDTLAKQLVALSALVTPTVVDAELLDAPTLQAVLLQRALDHIEDWLARAAGGLRAALGIDAARHTVAGDTYALGLRAATIPEIIDLPGVGAALAESVAAHVARGSAQQTIDDLTAIDGIGAKRVEQLRETAYLDRPRVGLLSPGLWRFCTVPGMSSYLDLLRHTDLSLVYGDSTRLEQIQPHLGGSSAERLRATLALIVAQAARRSQAADGVLATEAAAALARRATRERLLAECVPVAASDLLIGEHYVTRAKAAIESAEMSIQLMVFLATAADAPGDTDPLALVQALEEAAARGVETRVILDRDDGGVPYRSALINQPLVKRLKAAGVGVKFDDPASLLHSKVLIVDAEQVIVGSHNWTRASFRDTHELSVVLEAPAVAQRYAAHFDALWARQP